jgi:mannose-6-phosphate isomerase-like protein (cupin superfamily)
MNSSAKKVYRWAELPSINLLGGTMVRTGFRGDDVLLTFNRIQPTMQRWEPHHHPFDQIVLTVEGRQLLEIEGEAMECTPGTIVRVPADARHTGWPIGNEPVLNIDVFAPPRPDYLFLVEYQKEYPQPPKGKDAPAAYHQVHASSKFSGKMVADTSDILFKWKDLPRHDRFDGFMMQSGFRGDDALLTFNWIEPGRTRKEPHNHPFDQIALVLEGHMKLEIDGEVLDMPAGSICRVPKNAMHTGWPVGDRPVLNMDVFAPPRQDYLFLTEYQKDYARRATA